MLAQQLVLVDAVCNLRLEQDRFHNEVGSLHTLYSGLAFLNHQISQMESACRSSPSGNVIVGFFSDLERHFGLPQGANVLIPCFYHWYGVTVVNFVRKVGLLQGVLKGDIQPPPYVGRNQRRAISTYCTSYVRSVSEISQAYIWRNKVFAHFADTDPYEGDNDALLQQVSFYPISYREGKLVVGGFQLFTGNFDPSLTAGADQMQGSGLPSWAMTDLHERFVGRYLFEVVPSAMGVS